MKKKIILIDATNIKSGGGLVHLKSILNSHVFLKSNFIFHIIGSKKTLCNFENFYIKKNSWFFERSFFFVFLWKLLFLNNYIYKYNFDLIFIPGGWFLFAANTKTIIISQNFILFDKNVINEYKYSFQYFKFLILRRLHIRSLKKSNGVIFLNDYVSKFIRNKHKIKNNYSIITHGVSDFFDNATKKTMSINSNNDINIVYTSYLDFYKKQNELIDEIIFLNKKGYNINLYLIGSSSYHYKKKIDNKIKKNNCIFYINYIDQNELVFLYRKMHFAVLASTCENLPITLIEYMKSKIPILCNEIEPCKEVLKDGGIYFDINNKYDFSNKFINLLKDKALQKKLIDISYNNSLSYNWINCANNTFKFIENSINKKF